MGVPKGVLVSFNPYDPAVIENPYPHYAWLRAEAPVYHNEEHDIWALSRYADVAAALRDYSTYSSEQGVGADYRPVPMMIANDPPEHARLRRFVQREFTPSAVASWQDRIAGIADELLSAALDGETTDWAQDVALPLPVYVITEMLGMPASDRADIKRWSSDVLVALAGHMDSDTIVSIETELLVFAQYISDQVDARRNSPAQDLLSLLLLPNAGEILTHDELVSFVVLLLVAGNETTSNLLAHFAQLMVEHPDQWEILRNNRELVPNAIEEALRYESPIQGFFRTTTQPVALHGQDIPENAKVMMLYASANRDSAQFVDADRFDVRRPIGNHVAFGNGIHLCLGAPIARLEATVLILKMLDRIAGFEAAGTAVRTVNPLLRGYSSLPIRVIPA